MNGCLPCWRWAAWFGLQYTGRNGRPITTVGLYRENHAEHLNRLTHGMTWWMDGNPPPRGIGITR